MKNLNDFKKSAKNVLTTIELKNTKGGLRYYTRNGFTAISKVNQLRGQGHHV